MKALYYIFGVALVTLASCSSGLYVGTEYDDLYYQSSDQPVTRVNTQVSRQVTEGDLKAGAYYDNMYAADTLVSKEYSNAVDYNDPGLNDNYYNYYDNYSYAGRLNRFYGNYFNPYWRDPFYSSWYPSFSFNYFGGSPFSYGYDPFYYDYYDPFYYGYGSGYGGFYNNYYYGGLYNRYYNPFYGSYYYPYSSGGYNSYSFNDGKNVTIGRRERPSTLSTRWSGGGVSSPTGSASRTTVAASRRSTDVPTGSGSAYSGRPASGNQGISSDSRRTTSPVLGSQRIGTEKNLTQETVKSGSESLNGTQSRRAVTTRPEYNSVNRTYTPSYSDPKMSTRPSYNNTRVNSNSNQYNNNTRTNSNINNSNINTNRSIPVQRNQSYSGSNRNGSSYSSQGRSGSSYSSSGSYSVPSRRSSGGGSFSSGQSSSGSSRSSYSGSSSGSGSYSSGSSGSSSSRSSSSGSSSGGGGGRRH
jgi:hypothetical protein